jgi:phosphate transport system permease protein
MQNLAQIIARHKRQDRLFNVLGIACTLVGLVTLSALMIKLIVDGAREIDWNFLSSFPSYRAERAGILSPLVGSVLVMLVTAATAVPLGIAAGTYLEEYGRKNRISQIIEVNISNLAGVPSIIYGLLSVGIFIGFFRMSSSILVGGLTLAMLILPIVIVATREALRSIPVQIREAAYALGATKWQVIRHHLLPYSLGGISTGVIISLSRALGETAPLIVVGAVGVVLFLPDPPLTTSPPFVSFDWLQSPYTVLPMQMFNWTNEPKESFHHLAAAAGLVLIAITLTLNAAAISIRYRARKRIKW